jgi:hypothetical protein
MHVCGPPRYMLPALSQRIDLSRDPFVPSRCPASTSNAPSCPRLSISQNTTWALHFKNNLPFLLPAPRLRSRPGHSSPLIRLCPSRSLPPLPHLPPIYSLLLTAEGRSSPRHRAPVTGPQTPAICRAPRKPALRGRAPVASSPISVCIFRKSIMLSVH